MPPTITPAGQEAANRIRQFRDMRNTGMTSSDVRSTLRANPTLSPTTGMATSNTASQMRVNVPPVVPADMLQNNTTMGDVFARRNELEQQSLATQQFNTDMTALNGRIQNTQLASPFVNPEQFLNRLLLRGTTETQGALDQQRGEQAQNIRGFAQDFAQAGTEAREQFGVADLQSNLAETRNRIAERQVQLRNTLRDFETNAERRGVAREFVESEKQAVQAEAAAELADLSIIESAQLGNLNEARAEVETLLNEKRQAFEMENMAIEAEIQRLEAIDTRESQARSEQLQIALQERTRQIETQLANEKEQREYLLQAAANGADRGTLTAITKATSPQQAAFLASPWIGRLDRLQAEASIANIYDQIESRAEQNKLIYGTIDGKPQTQTEKLVQGYATRMAEADAIINATGSQFTSRESIFGALAPSMLQSPERQQFEQAKRNFINAVLRRESGAVIGKEEFANADMQYFPQPGDSAGVLSQKAANRQTVISNFFNEANVPMPELQAESNTTQFTPGMTGTTASGLQFTILP